MYSGPDARAPWSRIGLLGALVSLGSALSLPWIKSAGNPLALGSKLLVRSTSLLALAPGWLYVLITLAPAAAALVISLRARKTAAGWWLWAAGSAGLLGVWAGSEPLIAAGQAAGTVASVAIWGGAVWLTLFGYAVVAYAGVLILRREPRFSAQARFLLWLPVLLIVIDAWRLVTAYEPAANWLIRVFQEETRAGGVQRRIREHLWLAGVSGALSITAGVLLGIWGYFREKVAQVSLYAAGIILTLPSLALFAMLMDPFAALANKFPILREYGVAGLGAAPAITGLALYGLLPVIRNTYTGLRGVSAAQVDAARGMGMSPGQVLFLVLLPRAVPVIMAGVRQTAVLIIGIATLAQLIGGGGLGYYILQGINRSSIAHILLGTIPAVLVAVAVDAVLELLSRALTPKGLRISKGVSV